MWFTMSNIENVSFNRYNNIKLALREMQQALEDAMQECSQFTDQLDGMLNGLSDLADQVNNAEPIAGTVIINVLFYSFLCLLYVKYHRYV